MYGPGVAVSLTGSSSARSRCGPMSTGSIPVVRRVTLLLRPGGFLGIWHIATILFSSSENPHYWRCYLNDRGLADLLLTPWEGDAWVAYPPRALAEALTRSRVLLQGYWLDWYYLGERFFEIHVATAQRRVPAAPPRHMCILEGMTPEDKLMEYDGLPADVYLIHGDYASYLTTRLQARLPEDRRRHRTPAYYRAQAEADASAGPTADLKQAPPQLQLDPEHATHAPAQRYQELYQRFCFARSYIARLYPELHERIGRLWRHQSHQSGAVARLQMEGDRLRTRLEGEGIPLDFSEEEDDDDDGSSSDDAPTHPPSSIGQAVAGPSRRRR
ncbi:hypothetical protein JCGZ_19718 [Jatropha curcas]|uniref:Aminotransferase-like plant mobile domain-containing protein n=1 Tax=Jatropha curcas TaxID=180498 RepID=A0A067JVP4_JATCU|nr:hypothetical protein JCGZ_19718 [Jatropha curcas]